MMNLPSEVNICEVGLRDGLQNEKTIVSTEDKLAILRELIDACVVKPKLVIGVPVGFVNILEAKDAIMEAGVPYIVAKGRKGGSNVAAAIVNALMYQITR